LTGCVTYYYPDTALEDGVYYAEDDPSYVYNSGDYLDDIYYPWLSLDYFYLGYNPYPVYGFAYGYPFGWGYAPWYYPYSYHGYYPPRYITWHQHPYRRHDRGNCMYQGGCQRHDNEYRHAGNDNENDRNRVGEEEGEEYIHNREGGVRRHIVAPINRYVSTAPSGYSGSQGMVIRNRETTKIGKSRLEPTQQQPAKSVSVRPVISSTQMRPPVTSTANTYSGTNTRSSSRSGHQRSRSSRSSRREDRD